MGGCLRATAAFITSVVLGGQLGSAAHLSLLVQHKCPPSSTICKREACATSNDATLPASSICEGHCNGQKHPSTSAECLEMAATRSLLFIPSARSAFHKHVLAPSQDEFILSAEQRDKAGAAIEIQHRSGD